MLELKEPNCIVEADEQSAVRSHQSYREDVFAVCHHSGRYLTKAETNPGKIPLLREQHDFPGFPELDRQFARAAHSGQHQHLAWNRLIIQAIAMAFSGSLLIVAAAFVLLRGEFVGSWFEFVIFVATPILAILIGLGLWIGSLFIISSREWLFHRMARQKALQPAIADFPVSGSYEIVAEERLKANLSNNNVNAPELQEQNCTLKVRVYPSEDNRQHYREYLTLYPQNSDGFVHAGVLGLENHKAIVLSGNYAEFNHRLVLRQPAPAALRRQYAPSEAKRPLQFVASYQIQPAVIYEGRRGERRRFPLECKPYLKDSFTLVLAFHWHHQEIPCYLQEYRLEVPPELGRVERVKLGRYEPEEKAIIWRDLEFNDNQLRLEVSFSQPILRHQPLLKGSYHCSLDDLLSGLVIGPDRLWDARGLSVHNDSMSLIKRDTFIEGDLMIDTRRLLQEHEHVEFESLHYEQPPDHDLVDKLLFALVQKGINILRIEEAKPRLDPAGTLKKQLRYWDINGRYYHPQMLDAADIHLVVSGIASTPESTGSYQRSQIDLYVRCLHDPRNQYTPHMVGTVKEQVLNEVAAALASETASAGPLKIHLIREKTEWALLVQNADAVELSSVIIRFDEHELLMMPPSPIELNRLASGALHRVSQFQLQFKAAQIPELDALKLRELVTNSFSEEEIKFLCFDLRVAYDDLPGSGRSSKIVELIGYMERHGTKDALLAYCLQKRPHIFGRRLSEIQLPFAVVYLATGVEAPTEHRDKRLRVPAL